MISQRWQLITGLSPKQRLIFH